MFMLLCSKGAATRENRSSGFPTRGYREADLRLCFRLCRLLVFPWGGSVVMDWGVHAVVF